MVTQPRRLPAEMVARWIASIDGTVVGKSVQLLHGLKRLGDPKYAEVCVCTSFFVLDELLLALGEIDGLPYKVIVIDEVHTGDRLNVVTMAILGYELSHKPEALKR